MFWAVARQTGPGYRVTTGRNAECTLAEHIGRRVRERRAAMGWTQEDLAARLRLDGLPWYRSAVAAFEAGTRDPSVVEVLLLADILGIPVFDLLAGVRPRGALVALTNVVRANEGQIGLRLSARPDQVEWGSLWADKAGQAAALQQILDELDDSTLGKTWGATPEQALRAAGDVHHEAVIKAGKALGRAPVEIALAAILVWGRGFVEERDTRLSLHPKQEGMTARTRQAVRGRITRDLLSELGERLPKLDEGAR